MGDRVTLTDDSLVPADGSHRRDRGDGQQVGYVVLSEAERARGFVKPVRRSYLHRRCRSVTTMGLALAETYAREPGFYTGTFCCACGAHFPLAEFEWEDGEPMDPSMQAAWAEGERARRRDRDLARARSLRERAAVDTAEADALEAADMNDARTKETTMRDLVKLLREARKIIQCHHRDLHKDWLQRSADALRRVDRHD